MMRPRSLAFFVCLIAVLGLTLTVGQIRKQPAAQGPDMSAAPTYDPLAAAIADPAINNLEASVVSQCYTATAGVSNPCWTCHTNPVAPNELTDYELQEEYAFSDVAMRNHWSNLFYDAGGEIAAISDEEVLAYIRQDNYTPLRQAMASVENFPGYVPDLDFKQGFNDDGFATDGSGWRAIRYKPFLGTFWPTNGNVDDVMIRLPKTFQTRDGAYNHELHKANYAVLEAIIAAGPQAGSADDFRYPIEPINEAAAGVDLNHDGDQDDVVEEIIGFPTNYFGDAADQPLRRYVYPQGVEFLHTVRYVDPEDPSYIATRMKEVRYSKKIRYLDSWGMTYYFEREYNEKEEGEVPFFEGSPFVGYINSFGWQLQGYIEDEQGRLRLQTAEEQQYCMGCHSALGVTVDQTFTLARKIPGREGWRYQDLRGIPDTPQQGHAKNEIATYFERVTGGDEFRANREVLDSLFEGDAPMNHELDRAGVGGDRDILHLIGPTHERALELNKAYMALVRRQTFKLGRDTIIGPIENVHTAIDNGDTDLAREGKVFLDGVLWLDWSQYLAAKKPADEASASGQ